MKLIGGDKCRKVWERVSGLWTQHESKIGFPTMTTSRKLSAHGGNGGVQQATRARQGEASGYCCPGSQRSNKAAFQEGKVLRRFASQQGGAKGRSTGGVCLI